MKRFLLSLLIVSMYAQAETTNSVDLKSLQALLEKQSQLLQQQQQQIDALASGMEKPKTESSDTKIGMYGEAHYNHIKTDNADLGNNNVHLHRLVMLLSHQFNSNLRFYSEVEYEGSPDSRAVEVEVEQAFIEWRVQPQLTLNIGQFLVPVGLLNETHEPDAFYGVERNPIEEKIIPSTWWEKGVLANWRIAPQWQIDFAAHTGLNGAAAGGVSALGTADGLREFRQEFGGAIANDLAYTLRAKFRTKNGIEVGTSLQRQQNIVQTQDILVGGEAPAWLATAYTVGSIKDFTMRALFAEWKINNDVAKQNGTDVLRGFYLEPSYKVNEKIGVFARYNQWNVAQHKSDSVTNKQVNIGINYWLDPRVVLKADIQNSHLDSGLGDGFNLGMGMSF